MKSSRALLSLLLAGIFLSLHSARANPAETQWRKLRDFYEGLALGEEVSPSLENSPLRYQMGDNADWADPGFDDGDWRQARNWLIPSHAGVFWVRFRIRDLHAPLASGVYVQASMAFDLYWDGKLIGSSGRPGNNEEEEVVGPMDNLFTLPEELRGQGEKLVALRVSNYRNGFPGDSMPFRIAVVDPPRFQSWNMRSTIASSMAAGGMSLVAIVSIVMCVMVTRHPGLLLLAGLCLGTAIVQILLIARFGYGYTYDWHFPAIALRNRSIMALSACLLLLVIVQFRPERWQWLATLAGFLVGAVLGVEWGPVVLWLMPACWCGALGTTIAVGRGAKNHDRSVWLVASGLGTTLLLWFFNPTHFFSSQLLWNFLPTLLALTIALALDFRRRRQRTREIELTAARLEIELLKKNLQPHFLLNTLAVLSEVIERDPHAAVALIDDLGSVLRGLARMSGETRVPLRDEIELCENHLRVLGVRMGVSLALDSKAADPSVQVPPAIILTLIENALVHQDTAKAAATFELRTEVSKSVRIRFFSPGKIRVSERPQGGTGMRYIRARLEESFPGRWSLVHGPVQDGWETVVEFPAIR